MDVLSKMQPFLIVGSAFLGIALGKHSPAAGEHSGKFVEPFLMTMLFFLFLSVDVRRIAGSFRNLRFSVPALILNFVWTPVFAFLLGGIFFRGRADLQTGFIMLMVTPCTDWYLIFTGLAKGNVALGSSILPLNLILQIVLLPAYLLLFMGKTVSIDPAVLGKSIVYVLVIPLGLAWITALVCKKAGLGAFLGKLVARSEAVQFILLCLAIVAMFASQGALLSANLVLFLGLLAPLLIFFAANFVLSCMTGKVLRLPFADTVPLVFTTSARNSPVSLAIAVITFPAEPLISLVLVMGPLIELPVLGIDAMILKRFAGGFRKECPPARRPS